MAVLKERERERERGRENFFSRNKPVIITHCSQLDPVILTLHEITVYNGTSEHDIQTLDNDTIKHSRFIGVGGGGGLWSNLMMSAALENPSGETQRERRALINHVN